MNVQQSIEAFIALLKETRQHFNLLEHNGETIRQYPTGLGWNLVPFPMEKGIPFCADNLATISRAPFLNDTAFLHARQTGEDRWPGSGKKRDISWRLDIMLWAIAHALKIRNPESIFVECGTGLGYMAAAICDYFKNEKPFPDFYLIDSFMPNVPDVDGHQDQGSKSFVYADGDAEVRSYFSPYPFIKILTGYIPDILSTLPPDKPIAFLHVDLNSPVAEAAALDALLSRLQKGAIVLFDDYGGFGGDSQAEVHEAFAKRMHYRLMTLPTGQAVYFHV